MYRSDHSKNLIPAEEKVTELLQQRDKLDAQLAAERAKVRVLRNACEGICEEWGKNHDANPIGAGQRMETLASKMLEDMKEEQ